jgi:hypothetical protein
MLNRRAPTCTDGAFTRPWQPTSPLPTTIRQPPKYEVEYARIWQSKPNGRGDLQGRLTDGGLFWIRLINGK